MWLPQETILFDGAALSRTITADLAVSARFLAVESVILGREAMGEHVQEARLTDRWRIQQAGRLIFADDIAFAGEPPATPATLGTKRAFATVVLVAPEAEDLLEPVRAAIGDRGAASAWSGKLVARLVATDGFDLRKSLIPALTALAGEGGLPKTWSY
jgi:urease accessory protein